MHLVAYKWMEFSHIARGARTVSNFEGLRISIRNFKKTTKKASGTSMDCLLAVGFSILHIGADKDGLKHNFNGNQVLMLRTLLSI